MDLFEIWITLGVSLRSHSVRDKSTVLNVYIFQILKAVAAQFYWKSLLRADQLHPNHLTCLVHVNQKTCKVHNLLQPFEATNYHLSFLLLITRKIASLTVKRFLSRLHSMSIDGTSKDGWKMSPMHITLKAGVIGVLQELVWGLIEKSFYSNTNLL